MSKIQMMNSKNKKIMKNEKKEEDKVEEVASGGDEAELARDIGGARRVASPRDGFFRSPRSTGSQLIEELLDDE